MNSAPLLVRLPGYPRSFGTVCAQSAAASGILPLV